MHSPTITNLIKALSRLPSVGPRTAERFVFHWLKSGKKEVDELRLALQNLLVKTKSCETCWTFADTNPCPICANTKRDHSLVCVIAEPADMEAIEKTGQYHGTYHLLRGVIDTASEGEIKNLKISELLARVKKDDQIRELILAFNPDMAGETTMMYLERELLKTKSGIKISRLARGLPMGSDLQYADDITLSSALKNRTGI